MADSYLDKVKAEQWKNDVADEIALVDDVISKCSELMKTYSSDADDIIQIIRQNEETIEQIWEGVDNGFQTVIQTIFGAIDSFKDLIDETIDEAKNVYNHFIK